VLPKIVVAETIDEVLKQRECQQQRHHPRLAELQTRRLLPSSVTAGCTTRWMLSPLKPLLWLTRSTSSKRRLISRPIFCR